MTRLTGYRIVHVHREGEPCDWLGHPSCTYRPGLLTRLRALLTRTPTL